MNLAPWKLLEEAYVASDQKSCAFLEWIRALTGNQLARKCKGCALPPCSALPSSPSITQPDNMHDKLKLTSKFTV